MIDTVRNGKDRLFNFRPVFFVAAFLGLGVVFSCLRLFHGICLWWLCLLLGLLIPFAFCGKKGMVKTAMAVCALLFAFFFGGNAFAFQVRNYVDAPYYNGVHSVRGTVEEKSVGKWNTRLVLSDISVNGKDEKFTLIAYLPTAFADKTELFDEVVLKGTLTTFDLDFTAEDFNATQLRDGIRYRLDDVESCAVVGHKFHLFGWIRARIEKVIYSGMDEDPASVTLAVLTGNTHGIEDGLLANMRYGGIAHIFAVSGLHVGALFAFCLFLTSKTKLKKTPKPVRFLLVAFVLIFYGGICGFSASILRATILCLVGYAAKLIGTSMDKLEALGAAAIFILLLSPVDLFLPGFQLSFLACLGIFLWCKPLEKWGNHVCDEIGKRVRAFQEIRRIERNNADVEMTVAKTEKSVNQQETPLVSLPLKVRQGVISFLSVSTAAQIATAPVLLHTFGYLSGWSLLLNCIFVPLISASFSLLLVGVAIACFLPLSVAPILLYVPNVIWSAALLVFEAFDFSVFVLKGVTLTVGAFICYYGALSFFSDKWNLTVKQRRGFGLLCAAGFIVVVLIVNFR